MIGTSVMNGPEPPRAKPLRPARFFGYAYFALQKEKTLDPQVFSRVGKTIKKLQRKTSKDRVIVINYLHLKLKQLSTTEKTINYLSGAVLKNICSENFLQIIINAYVAEFFFSKTTYFQQILMNTFN